MILTIFQVKDFVDRYMPAYAQYLPDLYEHGPDGCKPGDLEATTVRSNKPKPQLLSFAIDEDRNPVGSLRP